MPQADAEDRLLADQVSKRPVQIADRRGIAGAVRDEDAVGRQREHVFGRHRGRHDGDVAAGLGQPAQNVVLDARVERDDTVGRLHRQHTRVHRPVDALGHVEAPAVRLRDADLGDQIPSHEGRGHTRLGDERSPIAVRRRDHGLHGARLAYVLRQPPSVDSLDGHDAKPLEKRRQALLGTPTRRLVRHLPHDNPAREHGARLHVGAIDPVVADVRHGHGDDLTGV